MNEDLKETVLQVADYSNAERARLLQKMHWFFIATLIGVTAPLVITALKLESVLPYEFIKGFGIGAAVGVIILGIIFTGKHADRIREAKMRMLKKAREKK